jgi:magnesium-transporting ATPase (P-type)
MESEVSDTPGYDLRECVVLGGSASTGIILTFFFLEYISYHPILNTSTINEMLIYAQLFFISFFSYFAAAVAVWKLGRHLSKKLPLWFPISVIGSVLFSFSFALMVHVAEPTESSLRQVFLLTMYFSVFLTLFTAIFTSIASSIYGLLGKDSSIDLSR